MTLLFYNLTHQFLIGCVIHKFNSMISLQTADDNYLRVHNLTEASVKGDWIRLFSPIENFTEATCLNFLYFSRYMDVKVFAYNETYTETLLVITYDGQERYVRLPVQQIFISRLWRKGFVVKSLIFVNLFRHLSRSYFLFKSF